MGVAAAETKPILTILVRMHQILTTMIQQCAIVAQTAHKNVQTIFNTPVDINK
jgi:hypothetical protein